METISISKSHGGIQGIYRHDSAVTATPMMFSVFVPPHERGAKLPVVWFLSGLTCTHVNVTEKGEYRATCAKAGIALILRRQPGYDHGYYFVSSVMADHLAWHAERLR